MLGFIKKTIISRQQKIIRRQKPAVNIVLHSDMPSPSLHKMSEVSRAVARINSLEPEIIALSDGQLKAKTQEFREKILGEEKAIAFQLGELGELLLAAAIPEEKERLKEKIKIARNGVFEEVLPEAFAVVREASRRTIGLRHFDVQLAGGIVLHEGKIAEMATGEGKTLAATLSAYLNALLGKGVHIVTVNDYLARRDRDWMGPIYEFLGLSVGAIQHEMSDEERKKAYLCDITYGTNNEFGFDYLRDNMKYSLEDLAQRPFYYAIVDEVDSILIDEARTPLIISGAAEESTEKYYIVDKIIPRLKGKKISEAEQITAKHKGEDLTKGFDYIVDEKGHAVYLSEEGESRVCQMLNVNSLHDMETMEWRHHVIQSLHARNLYEKDVDYVIKDGQVIIVDEFTGRMMPGRRWSDGLHQAVEAKEGLKIERENQTLATITFQNYFRMYEKLAGMTGTALTEANEFKAIYKLDVIVVPTNRPLIRTNYADRIYKTEKEKFAAAAEEICQLYQLGRPVLVGTISIEKSERLSRVLELKGVTHQVLNAKYHETEAQIVAQAGKYKAVTIATNMAGRGTDIILGGNPEFMARNIARQKLDAESPGYTDEYKELLERYKKEGQEEHEKVVSLAGLHVLGTERHEARRIDNQLRGRSGRQGDPGSSRFYVSLEDELMRLFGSDRIMGMMDKLGLEEGQVIEHPWVSKSIEIAQRRVEQHNFEIRKQLLEYDNVMNKQREVIYGQRRQILEGAPLKEYILETVQKIIYDMAADYFSESQNAEGQDTFGLTEKLRLKFGIEFKPSSLKDLGREQLKEFLYSGIAGAYEGKEKALGQELMRNLEYAVFLQILDSKWKDHLYAMDSLREGIGLRAYGQRDPLIEYKREGFDMFSRMLTNIEDEAVEAVFKLQPAGAKRARGVFSSVAQQFVHPEAEKFEKPQEDPLAMRDPHFGGPNLATPPTQQAQSTHPKVGRNEPCPCGRTDPTTGKPIKYKKCCGR